MRNARAAKSLVSQFFKIKLINPIITRIKNLTAPSHRHTFSNREKRAYIDAELCLMSKPASQKLSAAVTRFDELQAVHQIESLYTHFVVSSFLVV